MPSPGQSWEPQAPPARQPHDYARNGAAKLLTLFRPATGQVRARCGPGAGQVRARCGPKA
jgi:hypothetical protein